MPRPRDSKYTIRRRNRGPGQVRRPRVVMWGGTDMTAEELRAVQVRLREESVIVREKLGG